MTLLICISYVLAVLFLTHFPYKWHIPQTTEVLPPCKFGCQLCTGHNQTKSGVRYVITRNGCFLERGESSPHMRILSSYEARGHIDISSNDQSIGIFWLFNQFMIQRLAVNVFLIMWSAYDAMISEMNFKISKN